MSAPPNDSYNIGDKVRLWFTTKRINLDGSKSLADPTLLSVVVMQEDETEDDWTAVAWPTDAAVVRYSLGVFYYEYLTTKSGLHYGVPKATGAVTCSGKIPFKVDQDPTDPTA